MKLTIKPVAVLVSFSVTMAAPGLGTYQAIAAETGVGVGKTVAAVELDVVSAGLSASTLPPAQTSALGGSLNFFARIKSAILPQLRRPEIPLANLKWRDGFGPGVGAEPRTSGRALLSNTNAPIRDQDVGFADALPDAAASQAGLLGSSNTKERSRFLKFRVIAPVAALVQDTKNKWGDRYFLLREKFDNALRRADDVFRPLRGVGALRRAYAYAPAASAYPMGPGYAQSRAGRLLRAPVLSQSVKGNSADVPAPRSIVTQSAMETNSSFYGPDIVIVRFKRDGAAEDYANDMFFIKEWRGPGTEGTSKPAIDGMSLVDFDSFKNQAVVMLAPRFYYRFAEVERIIRDGDDAHRIATVEPIPLGKPIRDSSGVDTLHTDYKDHKTDIERVPGVAGASFESGSTDTEFIRIRLTGEVPLEQVKAAMLLAAPNIFRYQPKYVRYELDGE